MCRKGKHFLLKMVYKRVRGWTSEASLLKVCWVPPGEVGRGLEFKVFSSLWVAKQPERATVLRSVFSTTGARYSSNSAVPGS